MPPTLILIRHAQALHNATKNYDICDPDLTEEGREQCAVLREGLIKDPLAKQAELIITSPMRRTIQTALGSVDWLIEKGVKIEADACWQENSAKPCDTGSPVEKVKQEFPIVDFANVDGVWPDKTSEAAYLYRYNKQAILLRCQEALKKLYDRPEKVIVVVSHSGFLRLAVTGTFFFNADYRIFDFADRPSAGDSYRLEQHAQTKEKGGGLGRSFTHEVVIGEGLPGEPDELPQAET
ncbi:histidine phosphatase superfamily [Xylariaceae sp. FL0016]|nr:histidine phosphatase superfamily [Xylariaceae sp. FL0016]